mmetsp:Transcript_16738/g.36213  ORF Transcript_16738/g.36213 Transcript_16738/m.36213 type:complete len:239 (-) Transcript_16738:1380-2096(-)|eukprot:CAMPEP_0202902142 /NCGR_PEP_ID=MMETSP1392-20130828/16560_1 /ASSEMBLY_ACC=CAM_ASM_000868 /TAXON_ID=225041 /ORGANISM="Chlamydomonas chlamydogama, Strain SAG 11-48b" /LENGTH=238 /DNA_ID=CAMNT_0049588861 /DNA_START=239 /DNA_END=955 /DNA_ORIENTATION=+
MAFLFILGTSTNTILKGAFCGALIGLCTEMASTAYTAAKALLYAASGHQGSSQRTVAEQPNDVEYAEYDTDDSVPLEILYEDLARLVEIALDSPRRLMSGRVAQAYRRVLQNAHRLRAPAGEAPWQLLLIHQRLDSIVETMQYDELNFLIGAYSTPPPATSRLLKRLPRSRVSAQHLEHGVGVGAHTSCPICLQEYSMKEVLCELPRCKHVYHEACVVPWLTQRSDCPLCRQQVAKPL